MELSLTILIPIALILVALAIKIFFWAVNTGQYDDLDAEASRILFDDDVQASAQRKNKDSAQRQNKDSAEKQDKDNN